MPLKAPQIEILVLVAGNNQPSNSALLADHLTQGLHAVEGMRTEILHVKDLDLEHFSLKHYDARTDQGKDFEALKTKIERAKGIVIATPIWNFSVPAHLKNLIDRIGSFALDPATRTKGMLGNKPFFLLFTGGAGNFAWNSVMENSTSHMREAIKYFGGTVIDTHFEPKCVEDPERTFALVVDKRPQTLELMKKKGKQFAEVVKNFAETGQLPAKKAAKSLFYRTAGWVVKKMT